MYMFHKTWYIPQHFKVLNKAYKLGQRNIGRLIWIRKFVLWIVIEVSYTWYSMSFGLASDLVYVIKIKQ